MCHPIPTSFSRRPLVSSLSGAIYPSDPPVSAATAVTRFVRARNRLRVGMQDSVGPCLQFSAYRLLDEFAACIRQSGQAHESPRYEEATLPDLTSSGCPPPHLTFEL